MGIGEIATGITVVEKIGAGLRKLWDWQRARRNPPPESIPSRFVRLFESHGVHRNQIPRFFGHGIVLPDMQNDDSLRPKLDDTVLDAACELFAVRREWLEGAEPQVHPCHDFYKWPEDFGQLIRSLKHDNPDGRLCGVLVAPTDSEWDSEALLILQESVGVVGGKEINRYHLCNNWSFGYWKSRCYLTACVAQAWKTDVFIHGTYASKNAIALLSEGKTLLGWNGEGIWSIGRKKWDPEDMALNPEAFLQGVEPERANFGIRAGLELWLDLDTKGLMATGLGQSVRPLFENELAKWKLLMFT